MVPAVWEGVLRGTRSLVGPYWPSDCDSLSATCPTDRAARGVRPLGTEPPTARYSNETDYEKLDTERANRAVAATMMYETRYRAVIMEGVFGPEGVFEPTTS